MFQMGKMYLLRTPGEFMSIDQHPIARSVCWVGIGTDSTRGEAREAHCQTLGVRVKSLN